MNINTVKINYTMARIIHSKDLYLAKLLLNLKYKNKKKTKLENQYKLKNSIICVYCNTRHVSIIMRKMHEKTQKHKRNIYKYI